MKEIAYHILDILQNSLRAEAGDIKLTIEESQRSNSIRICIEDDGKGMEKEMLLKVFDPYTTSRTSRKIGMGLSLLKYQAELSGGGVNVESEKGKGTSVNVWFQKDHIDRQPLGDIAGVVRIMLASGNNCNFFYKHKTDTAEFEISTDEIKASLGIEVISDNQLLEQLRELIYENLISIESELN
ncbi:MAG: ATP-binding protein [Bacteroidales bacterium]|nr:ATP-binding protein [Bacteroidales bacterium]MCF8390498.1 ATP-binding protein [Bacteroidales bacterium]